MTKQISKILFQNTNDHHTSYCDSNLGSAAVIQCAAQALKIFFPQAEINSLIQLSPDFAARNNIRVVPAKRFSTKSYSIGESIIAGTTFSMALIWLVTHKYLHLNIPFLVKNKPLSEYINTDIIVNLSMDLLNDNSGLIPVIENTRDMILCKIFEKPLIIYAQSIGPYNSKLTGWIARFGLNKASLITAREDNCIYWLKNIGVKKPPVHLTADPAFLLEPVDNRRVKEIFHTQNKNEDKPLIAIAVYEGLLLRTKTWKDKKRFIWSIYQFLRYLLPEKLFSIIMIRLSSSQYYKKLSSSTRNSVISATAELTDFLATKLNATVLLLPHVIFPEELKENQLDARYTVKDVYKSVSNKDKVIPFTERYTAEEIKGIVGQCDMVVTAKMHVAIAATSQCIPTLVIGAHPKFEGIMRALGMEEWVCDEFSADAMIAKTQQLWCRKEQVKKILHSKIPSIKELSLLNAKLIAEMINPGA